MPRETNRVDPETNLHHFWTHYNSWKEFLTAAQEPLVWKMHGDESNHYFNINFKTALEFAKYGWPEGRARLLKLNEKINLQEVQQQCSKFARSYDLGGMIPDIQAFVAGAPDHMIDFGEQEIAHAPIIKLQINIDSPSFVGNSGMENQAIAAASLIDCIETQGYQVELRLANATFASGGNRKSLTMFTALVKNAGEYLDPDLAVFALGHPAVLRQFLFRIYKTNLDIGTRFRKTMGAPTATIPEDYTDPGTINIPPADLDCISPERALKKLILLVKNEHPGVNWNFLDLVLAKIEQVLTGSTIH